MRRNMPRGSGRAPPRIQGPLMTEHLKNLDLELNLLKRKRQMFEQQQMFSDPQSQYSYEQSSVMYEEPYNQPEQFNSKRNYSYMYDNDPNTSNSYNHNQFGRKRPVNTKWQSETPPKRFSGSKGRKSFGNRMGQNLGRLMDQAPEVGRRSLPNSKSARNHKPQQHFSEKPVSLMSLKPKPSISQKLNKPTPKSNRNDFKPNKVSKAKTGSQSNAIDTYPIGQRKKLIAEASNLVAGSSEGFILHPNQVPSQQMTGRLELALGNILKEIKQTYSGDKKYSINFQSQHQQKIMKQLIRERIRKVMLGKVVGNVVDIVDSFRKEFPISTDIDIVQAAVEVQETMEKKKLDIKITESVSDDPERYFHIEMRNLIDNTLNEMFRKLYDLYSTDNENLTDDGSVKKSINDDSIDSKNVTGDDSNCKNITDDSNIINDDGNDSNNVTDDANDSKNISDDGNVSKNITDAKEDADGKKDENDVNNIKDNGKNVENADVVIISPDKNTSLDTAQDNPKDKIEQAVIDLCNDNDNNENNKSQNANPNSKFAVKNIDNYIFKRMPMFLRKHIPQIVKLLNVNPTYKKTSAEILTNATELASSIAKKETVQSQQSVEKQKDNLNTSTQSSKQALKIPYFVKIFARPSLPKRKAMQTFLDQFNPRTIKKHKSVHSLLFVGFCNKDDCDKILAANGSLIGKTKLEIKISQSIRDTANNSEIPDDNNEKDEEEATNNISINSDLDNQIDDLLSSIRKSDEVDEIKADKPATEDKDAIANEVPQQSETTVQEKNESETGDIIKLENKNDDTIVKSEIVEINENSVEEDKAEKELKKIDENKDATEVNKPAQDMKNETQSGISTPTRASARLATSTPSTIRTRRASKLIQNN